MTARHCKKWKVPALWSDGVFNFTKYVPTSIFALLEKPDSILHVWLRTQASQSLFYIIQEKSVGIQFLSGVDHM